ncbi:GH32 C-terminal domain-containing protein [Streptococcus pluranimalium]
MTDDDGWAHCLTLPRELVIENNHLYQRPIPELKALRKAHRRYSGDLHEETIDLQDISRTYELKLKVTAEELEHFALTLRKGHGEETVFSYDHHAGKLELDLRKSGKTVTAEYGRTRSCDFQAEYLELHLFLDESSLEIFVNDGHEVFTSRLFSHQDANGIQLTSKGKVSYVLDLWEV